MHSLLQQVDIKQNLAGAMFMICVYVAQVSMGANLQQTLKAIAEAERLARTIPHHRLLPMRDALHQGRHGSRRRGDEASRDRLLEPLSLQPSCTCRPRSSLDSNLGVATREFLMNGLATTDSPASSQSTKLFKEERGIRNGSLRSPCTPRRLYAAEKKEPEE